MSRYRTVAVFVLLSAVWGTAFMATKVGLAYLPPTLFAAVRFDIAAVVLFGFVALTGRDWRPRARRDWYPILAGGGFTIGLHHALLFAGQQYVTSAVAAVLLGLIPVVTPALTRLTSAGERLSPTGALGVALGFVGVVVIADPTSAGLRSTGLWGVALVLGSALAFAVGAVLTHETTTSMSLVGTQAWMMLVGAVLLHVASAALPGASLAATTWTPTAVAALLYLALVAGAAGFLMYFYLLDRLGPIEAGLIEYVIPVFAAVAGWLALGETLSASTVVGFGVIFVGFVLVKRRTFERELRRWRGTAPTDADPASLDD
jgi:drug/metabolite transporter (DMT)-like permease